MKKRAACVAAIGLAVTGIGAARAGAATAPASQFDASGQHAATTCVRLAGPSAPLRFADGTPTGFSVSDKLSPRGPGCAPGMIRLDLHEIIPSPAGPLVFHRGGNHYAGAADVKYGAVSLSDIAGTPAPPAPVPAGAGRGAACTLGAGPAYAVSVQSIPKSMHYKRPQDVASGSNRGASFMHYGDPGSDQGTRHGIHYSYLLWSFVDVHGGGMARSLLAPGQIVQPCDVAPITMPSWDSSGAVNGSVTARYVEVQAGSCPLYGWMVWSHTYGPAGTAPVAHATLAHAAPPPAQVPGPGCPAV
jgi:hypothetical protein